MKKSIIDKLQNYQKFWGIITILGISLIAFMIIKESEPGLLPLVITLTGIIGFVYTHYKKKLIK